VAPSIISIWKDEILHNSIRTLETEAADKREIKQLKKKNERLERKVGQLTLEYDFFAEACEDAGLKVR
jgi:transposase